MSARRRAALAGGGLVALVVFAALTLLVTRDRGAVGSLDQSWHDHLRRLGIDHPVWLATMRAVTRLGDTVTVVVADLALAIGCLYQRRRRLAGFVAVVGLGGWALRILVRELVDRPRPGDALWPAGSSSFPSGHTTNAALALALAVAVCWPLVAPPARLAMVAVAAGAAVAVGVSRVAGGVHWPTDVLAGWALAAAYGCLVASVFPWGRTADRDREAVGISPTAG